MLTRDTAKQMHRLRIDRAKNKLWQCVLKYIVYIHEPRVAAETSWGINESNQSPLRQARLRSVIVIVIDRLCLPSLFNELFQWLNDNLMLSRSSRLSTEHQPLFSRHSSRCFTTRLPMVENARAKRKPFWNTSRPVTAARTLSNSHGHMVRLPIARCNHAA